MVLYEEATTAIKRFQWEESSKYSQANNCGPTCVTFIAGFYKDVSGYGIETTRRLITGMGPYNVNGAVVYGAPQDTPTQPWQQRDMLIKRGVPAEARAITNMAQLRDIVRGGQHPVLVGLLMSQVPDAIKDHTFDGWHAVVIMDVATKDGVLGFWVMDPNFHPRKDGYRIDPDHGRKFYPAWVIQKAMFDANPNSWGVVPLSRKRVPNTNGRGRVEGPGSVVRTDPRWGSDTAWARARRDGSTYRLRDGRRLWANTQRYYFFGFTKDKKWAKVATKSGRRFYIHRSEFTVTRWP